MSYIKFIYSNGWYDYNGSDSVGMCILGDFLSDDVGCKNRSFFRDWILSDERAWAVSGNITVLEKEGDFIYLTDQYPEVKNPTEVKISRSELVRLIDEWREMVCKEKPKEVIIKHENDRFFIETIN